MRYGFGDVWRTSNADRFRNEDVLRRIGEDRRILSEMRKRKANWTEHALRSGRLQKTNTKEDKRE